MTPLSPFEWRTRTAPDDLDWSMVAAQFISQVMRHACDRSGVALLSWEISITSRPLRAGMLELVEQLNARRTDSSPLRVHSLGRFDQQTTTRFHLDGGPQTSWLLLGYEPSEVVSALSVADYSRAAQTENMSPQEYLDRYNPMFPVGMQRIEPYVQPLGAFDPARTQLVLINNSRGDWRMPGAELGVLHRGVIPQPNPQATRVINSMMLGVLDGVATNLPTEADFQRFRSDDALARSVYS